MKLKEVVVTEGGGQMSKSAEGKFPLVDVTRDKVEATVQALADVTGVPRHDFHVVGSAGKQQASGDIDVVIDAARFDILKIHKVITHAILRMIEDQAPEQIKVKEHNITHLQKGKAGVQMISYAFPIAGNVNNGFVQLDLIPSKNPDWLKFSMGSPGERSAYKGAVRNVLLGSAAATLYDPKIDKYITDPLHGDMLKIRRQFDIKRGLQRVFQMRKKAREGHYKKQLEPGTSEDIIGMFPDLHDFNMDAHVISDPNKAIQVIFGDTKLTTKDVESAEQVLGLIRTRLSPERQKKTFERANKWFAKLKNMNYPQI